MSDGTKAVIGVILAFIGLGAIGTNIDEYQDSSQSSVPSTLNSSFEKDRTNSQNSFLEDQPLNQDSRRSISVPESNTSLSTEQSCDENYSGCVPIVSYDLNCSDIGISVSVIGYDKHNFDADGDGIGCESYR